MNIKVALADDHPMVIEGISKILARYDQITIIGQYGTGKELLEGLKAVQPDVLLLDIHFPDTTGNELVRIIVPLYPDLKILVITSVDDPFDIQDMIKHGCLGYVQKSIPSALLIKAIESVYYGEEFIDPALKETLMEHLLRPASKSLKDIQLTTREKEVLALICEGCTNMDIGQRLFLSHRTIENHRLSLYQKFGVSSLASLVKLAVQYKFIK